MKDFIAKNTNQNAQAPYSELADKVALIEALLSEAESGSIAPEERYGKIHTVEDGRFYTAYLRIGPDSPMIEVTDDSFAVLRISRTSASVQKISMYFLIPELHFIRCTDCFYLESASLAPIRAEYLPGTMRLECKGTPIKLRIPDGAIEMIGDKIILPFTAVNASDPDSPGLEFNYLSFQVKVVFDSTPASE